MRRYIGTILGVCTILPAMWWAYERGKEDVDSSEIATDTQTSSLHKIVERLSNMEHENIRLQRELKNATEKISDVAALSKERSALEESNEKLKIDLINERKRGELVGNPQYSALKIIKINNPFIKNKKWRGHYTCAQGRTSLTLRIKSASNKAVSTELGSAYDVSAIFDFDYKNRTATGAFYIYGKYYPETKVAIFKAGEWIRNPAGYSSVGMDGIVSSEGTRFSGKILFRGCKSFDLTAS